MVCVLAHPDDESFSVGGTIALYAKNGWNITLVVVTNGEKGSSGDFHIESVQDLGIKRQEEVEKAALVLGIKHVEFLNFPDAGLKQLVPGTLEDALFPLIKQILPDIVITHDPTGITNHPDHIKVCYSTTYAFQKYAAYLQSLSQVDTMTKGRGKEWKQFEYQRAFGDTKNISKEPKLYYVCLSQSSIDFLLKEKFIPEESFEKPWKGTPDKNITTIIDITPTMLQKGKALLCHETQAEKVDQFISFVKNPEVKQECFVLRMQGVYEVFMSKADRYSDAL